MSVPFHAPAEPERGPVFGFYQSPEARRLMAQAFERPGIGELSLVEGGLESATRTMKRGEQPSLALYELDNADPTAEIDALRRQLPRGTPMIGLGPDIPLILFRKLLGVGLIDYLDVALGPQALADAIATARRKRMRRATDAGPAKSGKIILFAGMRGGLGTTSCAMAAAWYLGSLGRNTVLLDLDLTHGTVAFALDIDPGHGLRDGLQQPARLDALFIERSLVRHGDRLAILSAEEGCGEELGLDPAAVKVLLDELKQTFDCIVVDCPRGWPPLAATAVAGADDIVLVTGLTLAGLRDTLRSLKHLALAAPTALVKVIAGPNLGASKLPRADFEHNLGRKLDVVVPADPRAFEAASNGGTMLTAAAPASASSKAIAGLVAELGYSGEASRKPLLGNWLPRRIAAPAAA